MMRLHPTSLNVRRSLSMLALGLALSLVSPATSHGALVRYTISVTVNFDSTLGGVNVDGSRLTVSALIDSGTATTATSSGYTESLATTNGPVTFQLGDTIGTLSGFNQIRSRVNSGNSYSELVFRNSAFPDQFMGQSVSGTSNYLDLQQTSPQPATAGGFNWNDGITYTTTAGGLFINGVSTDATMTRTAAVPEPGQVALGVLAAGYALISAGRRYRSRGSTTA